MKRYGYCLSVLLSAVVLVVFVGCGQEQPAGKAGAPSAPAAESTGQAIVDRVKTPFDKSREVEKTLEKAADKTADTIKDATQ